MSQQALFSVSAGPWCVCVYTPAPTKSLISQPTVVVSSPHNGAVVAPAAVTGATDGEARYAKRKSIPTSEILPAGQYCKMLCSSCINIFL